MYVRASTYPTTQTSVRASSELVVDIVFTFDANPGVPSTKLLVGQMLRIPVFLHRYASGWLACSLRPPWLTYRLDPLPPAAVARVCRVVFSCQTMLLRRSNSSRSTTRTSTSGPHWLARRIALTERVFLVQILSRWIPCRCTESLETVRKTEWDHMRALQAAADRGRAHTIEPPPGRKVGERP